MTQQGRIIAVLTFITAVVLTGSPSRAQEAPAPGPVENPAGENVLSDSVRFLWEGMHEAGMIDDDQFQHVLEHGRLPGGSTVQNSPVSERRQKLWAKLSEEELVTPEELANMLFKGKIPNMTEQETRAFEDLAPVYEPDRRKRLAYDVRRKHIAVDMIRLKHRSHKEWEESHAEALEWAERSKSLERGETRDGSLFELMRIGVHGDPAYNITCNVNASKTISTDAVRPGGSTSFGLTGTNITLGMIDGGVAQTNHQEFAGRIRNADVTSMHEHPSGVAGTLAAAGVSTSAQGMAYSAEVDVYYWDDHIGDLTEMVATNIHLSNHSYGLLAGWAPSGWLGYYSPQWHGDYALSTNEDWHFGYYGGQAEGLDELSYDAPYHLIVRSCGNDRGEDISQAGFIYQYHDTSRGDPEDWFSADHDNQPIPVDGGTDGFDCMNPYAVAKNVMAVGSVADLPGGYSNGVSVAIQYYSAFGPTDDGRIKPDVVANGQSVYTSYSTATNGYGSPSGTSFSSPSVAGSMALLQELHERAYGSGQPMLASTMKALVIHTADDIDATGPDYKTGWGLMNTKEAAWVITNNASWNSLPHIKEVALNDGDYIEYDVLATTNEALKVTTCWTDPEGTIPAYELDPTNLMLINDLDLCVIAPDGATNFPWVLDMLNPTNAATTGDNYRDNVEQVVINDPTNDWYTIRVTHKGTLSNAVQDVSIIVTGDTPTNAPDFYISDVGLVGTNDLTQLEWPGVVGALYEVETSTNLLVSNGWTNANITLSAPRELLDWTDEDSDLYGIRFYRLKRLK